MRLTYSRTVFVTRDAVTKAVEKHLRDSGTVSPSEKIDFAGHFQSSFNLELTREVEDELVQDPRKIGAK